MTLYNKPNKKRVFLNYDWSRVPEFYPENSSEADVDKFVANTWSYLKHKLDTDMVSVAELRRIAGLKVELGDYNVGFDKRCLDYTGSETPEKGIKFLPIHLKRMGNYGVELVNLRLLSHTHNSLYNDVINTYTHIRPYDGNSYNGRRYFAVKREVRNER